METYAGSGSLKDVDEACQIVPHEDGYTVRDARLVDFQQYWWDT